MILLILALLAASPAAQGLATSPDGVADMPVQTLAPGRRASPSAVTKTSADSRVRAVSSGGDVAAISSSLLCAVQSGIRFREPAWTPARCEAVAGALNKTAQPVTMLAVCIDESDLRPGVTSETKGNVVDVGLCGVRCVLGKHDRCTNGPARGLTVEQLKEPTRNIEVAARILANKPSLRAYNGGTREHGYAARISAIVAALGGIQVRVKSKRMTKLTADIVRAVNREKKS